MIDEQLWAVVKKYALMSVLGIFALFAACSTFFTTELGYIYIVQDQIFRTINVYTEPGVQLKVPFFSNVYKYKQTMTISFGNEENGEVTEETRQLNMVSVQFADTYTSDIPATFRFMLPTDPAKIMDMHREFRTFDNLVDALLVKNAKNVTVVTATQYTGEEFYQGGLNDFKVKLEDQLENGLYQTVRRQVKVEQLDLAPISSENSSGTNLETKEQLVWKNVVLENNEGKPLRINNPLELYGIQVRQVTIGRPVPEKRLDDLLVEKKNLVAKRITSLQEQDTARTEAKTAQLQKEIEKTRAIQDATRDKELAIIQKQKEVAMEREQAELERVRVEKEKSIAVIEKEKELAIAEANKNIQMAAAEAAKFEAIAIKETGLAEAEVDRAKLTAKQSARDIYLAELQRDIAEVMYPALKDVKIDMPDYYAGSGGVNAPTSLDVFTTLGAMNALKGSNTAQGSPLQK